MRLLLGLYPRAWRERYGDEFLALLEKQPLGVRSAIDIVAAAIGERAIELFTLRNTRARSVARGLARFALTVVISIAGISCAAMLALILTTLPWRAERGMFAVPAFLWTGLVVFMQVNYMHNRQPGMIRSQPPLGPLSERGLATVWILSVAILVMAKWIQWTSVSSPPLALAGWPVWFSRFVDDPTHAFSVPLMMAAAASVYARWPGLRIGAEPPDVPSHPLGLT